MKPLIIEVPSSLGLWPSGVETAPEALREAGLFARLDAVDVRRVVVPPYCDVRDPETQILNPRAIVGVARRVADAVGAALDRERFPVVLGGDCSIALGPMLALRRRGRYGLAFIDCHADFWHPNDEPTGQAASLDLALLTGRGPDLLADLEGLGPLVRDEDVALVGYRAFGDNDHFLDEHVRDTAIAITDHLEVRRGGTDRAVEKVIATVARPPLDGFWVHFDVDVLDDDLMPAVDYHYPGGISWEEATAILQGVLGVSSARGLHVTIFNPRLDPDGSLAQRLADLIASSVPLD